ncbi:hypothetical protein AAFF_G00240420 [Aldrovandia affinis]|uniref:Uncharacterized protein n=1 Tax=Aldrovandia affinis TaxID=143900 RepID=A0AAD7SUM6_9TELE|nr:hypothetical protein AAFF_G00240420 [Aldrovandia affinis]
MRRDKAACLREAEGPLSVPVFVLRMSLAQTGGWRVVTELSSLIYASRLQKHMAALLQVDDQEPVHVLAPAPFIRTAWRRRPAIT